MKNKFLVFGSIIFFLLLAVGCYYLINNNIQTTDVNISPKIVLGSEPSSIDPAKSLTIDVRSYLSNLFEGLVNIDEKGSINEGVAYEWSPNVNSTEYIFKLRDNAMWSDGVRVTANDFKYAWLRVLNPETASGWASYLYYIKGAEKYNNGTGSAEDVGIDVIDDNTLKVTLEKPCSFFISMTALQPYYPVRKDIIEKFGDRWTENANSFISNGAFRLNEWKHDLEISVIKNDFYWNKKHVELPEIIFKLFSDSSSILNSYEAGEIDYVGNILTAEEMKQISEIKTSSFIITKFISLNLNNNIFSDIKLRKAISIALDREEISKIIGGQASPLLSFIPHGFYNISEKKDYTEDSNHKNYLNKTSSINEAKLLLKDIDVKKYGKIKYLTNTSSSNLILAEIIKNQLSKIGLDVEIVAVEKKIFNTYRKEKKYDIVAASWAAEYPDITSYLYGFKSSDLNNYSGFKNSEFDSIFNNIMSENNLATRFKMVHDAENLVMDSFAVIPLYYENSYYITSGNIKGYFYDVTGCLNFTKARFK